MYMHIKQTIQIQKTSELAKLPELGEPDAVGYDLTSIEKGILNPGERRLFNTGLIWRPIGFADGQIRPRSGRALKNGLTVLNTPGTIDPSYRGEIKVLLINLGTEPTEIKIGDKIAQFVIAPFYRANFEEVENIQIDTIRGEGGFGHTGG